MALAVFDPEHGALVASSYSIPSLRLMLTTRIGWVNASRFTSTQSRAAAMSENEPPDGPSTRSATMPASGATPSGATTPPELTMPETAVPCPSSSSAAPAPDCVSVPFGQQELPILGDGCVSRQKHSSATRSSTRSG